VTQYKILHNDVTKKHVNGCENTVVQNTHQRDKTLSLAMPCGELSDRMAEQNHVV
jgi:hypothetical protein